MQIDSFFNWLGEHLGDAIRFIVDMLSGFFTGIGMAMYEFIEGLTGSLGTETSLLNLILLILGLALLVKGIRSLLRRAFIGGALWIVLGLLILSWLMA